MGEEGAQKAARAAAQTRHEVVQDDLRDVRGGPAVTGDLLARLETTQLQGERKETQTATTTGYER